MNGLTTTLLTRACRIFLELAYPEGVSTIPFPKSSFFALIADEPLETLLAPPVCQALRAADGGIRGWVLRLGSAQHPHLKLQVVGQADGVCVFSVDTHDLSFLDRPLSDAPGWARFQESNRQLKEQIERAWEAAGIMTFNALLRRELAGK